MLCARRKNYALHWFLSVLFVKPTVYEPKPEIDVGFATMAAEDIPVVPVVPVVPVQMTMESTAPTTARYNLRPRKQVI